MCDDSAALRQALATLSDEFLIRQQHEGAWSGLHELRSAVVNGVLPDIPPPEESTTIADLPAHLDVRDATHLLRRTGDREGLVALLLAAIGARVAQADAAEVAAWLTAKLAMHVPAPSATDAVIETHEARPVGAPRLRFNLA